jgi:hypothetical protein
MRNFTVGLIAFAVAFAMCGIVFRGVVSAQDKSRQDRTSAFYPSTKMMPAAGGVPATFDADLY